MLVEVRRRKPLGGYGEHHDHRHAHFFEKNAEEEDLVRWQLAKGRVDSANTDESSGTATDTSKKTPGDRTRYRLGMGASDVEGALLRINRYLIRDRTMGPFRFEDLHDWRSNWEDETMKKTMSESSVDPEPSIPDQFSRDRYFYLATDERDQAYLALMKDPRAMVLGDLITDDFAHGKKEMIQSENKELGHLDMMGFQEWYGYLDLLVCTKAQAFLGSPMSVFSMAVINQRIVDAKRRSREEKRTYLDRGGGHGWLFRALPLNKHLIRDDGDTGEIF